MKQLLIIIFILIAGGAKGYTKDFDYSHITPHPRLLLKEGEERNIHMVLQKNTVLQAFHKRILDYCDETLKEPPVKRIKEGKRLLGVSRIVLKRVFYLSYAYRMTSEEKYLRRAEKEMLAAASFTDWNPSHFLDVSEMSMGLAIGYDWLFNELLPDSRKKIRQAIVEKAIEASKTKHASFYKSRTNWNQVCNGGLVCSALAIYEDEPEKTKEIINKALQTVPLALECYAPDGGYPEGFGYWSYGTSYQVMLNDALESSLGHDAGLSDYPGFLQSAQYIQYMTAPTGDCFNFSDASPKAYGNIMMFWFAHKTKNPSLLWFEKKYLNDANLEFGEYLEERFLPCLLIFASRIDLDEVTSPKGNTWHSRGKNPVYIYRSGWNSKTDTYLGVKGGTASTSHAHMDAGSFIYEQAGVRWAMDLGMQDYYSLESKGVDLWDTKQYSQRWQVFRIGSSAHNTLTIDGKNHQVNGFAELTSLTDNQGNKGAKINLTSILGQPINQATRTVVLTPDNSLEITDYIENKDTVSLIRWTMCTPTIPKITDNQTIVLTQGNKQLSLQVDSTRKVNLHIWDNTPPHDYDYGNPGTYRVGYDIALNPKEKVTIKVKFNLIKNE